MYDVQCPQCGEFRSKEPVKEGKGCPQCGDKQAMSLERRYDIDQRFRLEKEGKCTTR